MLQLLEFGVGLNPQQKLHLPAPALWVANSQGDRRTQSHVVAESDQIELLRSIEVQVATRHALLELQGIDPHANQVTAMDALVTLGDDGPDTKEHWAFRSPVTAGSRAIFLAREDDQRDSFGLVAKSGVVHRQDLAAGLDPRHPAANAFLLQKLILHTRIAEHPSRHHLKIPPT